MEHQITEYAVRVKGTQKYLVRSQRRDGRGGSHLEPVDFSLPRHWRLDGTKQRYEGELQIRTYATRAAAQNLLQSWCRGKFYSDGEGGGYLGESGDTLGRDPSDLEIVELYIILPA